MLSKQDPFWVLPTITTPFFDGGQSFNFSLVLSVISSAHPTNTSKAPRKGGGLGGSIKCSFIEKWYDKMLSKQDPFWVLPTITTPFFDGGQIFSFSLLLSVISSAHPTNTTNTLMVGRSSVFPYCYQLFPLPTLLMLIEI